MAFHSSYMMPMFSIPQVTWANQSQGQAAMGKFPNPRSVMKICKCLVSLSDLLSGRRWPLLEAGVLTIANENFYMQQLQMTTLVCIIAINNSGLYYCK